MASTQDLIDRELDLERAIRSLDKSYQPGEWTFYAAAIVLPFLAVFIAIVWLAKDRVGPGLAIMLTGWLGAWVWLAVLAAVGILNA